MRKVITLAAATMLSFNTYANTCETVRFADVGWMPSIVMQERSKLFAPTLKARNTP